MQPQCQYLMMMLLCLMRKQMRFFASPVNVSVAQLKPSAQDNAEQGDMEPQTSDKGVNTDHESLHNLLPSLPHQLIKMETAIQEVGNKQSKVRDESVGLTERVDQLEAELARWRCT